jgi:hypothetical protein
MKRASEASKWSKGDKPMAKLKFTIVAASVLAIGSICATVAAGPAQAAVQGGADAIRAASASNVLAEPVQFLWSGHNYCWADDGWRGPGWYWCGYAYRTGFGWGGPVGWNSWRRFDRDDFREHREFRDRDDFREHREFRDRDDFREHREFREREFRDRDDRRRY